MVLSIMLSLPLICGSVNRFVRFPDHPLIEDNEDNVYVSVNVKRERGNTCVHVYVQGLDHESVRIEKKVFQQD